MPTIELKIVPPAVPLKRDTKKIYVEGSTIYDVFDLLYRSYLAYEKRYQNGKWVNVLWGYIVYKNGRVIGAFDQDGFKAFKDADVLLNDGDKIHLVLPVGGG